MLLDTSGLLALLDAREPMYQQARNLYSLETVHTTHGFVLAELIALANARGIPAAPVVQFVMTLMANPDIQIIWPDESLTAQALALLLARQGRGYSLCDVVSFVIMRAKGIDAALSTDHHFVDEGFERLLK